MYLVGLTGGIATGKSTIANLFSANGVPVIDADELSRKVVEPGRRAHKKLLRAFGPEYFLESGEVDRKKLGDLVFASKSDRQLLNGIIHPEVQKAMIKDIIWYFVHGYHFIILDIPLLFETGFDKFLQKTIVVDCSRDAQLSRLMHRNEFSEAEAIARMDAQMPLEKKKCLASFVIDNSMTIENSQIQFARILAALKSSNLTLLIRILVFMLIIGFVWLLWWCYRMLM